MTVKESLERVVDELPEERLHEVLDFALFLNSQDESKGWRQFGQTQIARAYGPDEPEYTLADLKPELDS